MIARGYSLSNLKPSDVKWLEDSVHLIQIEEEFIHKARTYVLNGLEGIASLDDVWCTGLELRAVIEIIDYNKFVSNLKDINTKRFTVFMQGILGQPFKPRDHIDIDFYKKQLETETDPVKRRRLLAQIELIEDSILIYRCIRLPAKSSALWAQDDDYKHMTIMDPDGWDRQNFEESWNEEITKEEFDKRLLQSTVIMRPHQTTQKED